MELEAEAIAVVFRLQPDWQRTPPNNPGFDPRRSATMEKPPNSVTMLDYGWWAVAARQLGNREVGITNDHGPGYVAETRLLAGRLAKATGTSRDTRGPR